MAAFVMAPVESTWKAMALAPVYANDEEPTVLDVLRPGKPI